MTSHRQYQETEDSHDDGSVLIDPEGGFQTELQKVIVTEQSVAQMKILRETLRDSISATRMSGTTLVDDAISVAFLQGQLVVIDILINSKRVLHVDFGE